MNFDESQIQERMMRIGVEARCTDLSQVIDPTAKYREIAIKTLKEYKKLTRVVSRDVRQLFAKQIEASEKKISCFFYMLDVPGRKLEIFKIVDLNQLEGCVGELPYTGTFPRITRLPVNFALQ